MIQMRNEQRESYTEVLTILNHMEMEYQEKIPKKLIDFFERNSAKDYKFDIDLAIPLKEQELKTKTLSLLAMLNLNYWCNSDEEKQELIKHYSENEKKYQEELREKYNPDNLFKKRNQENKREEDIIKNEVALVEYKESIFKRFINRLKNIFHIN